MESLDLAKPNSQPKSNLHINSENPGTVLRIILLNITFLKRQHLLAPKNRTQNRGVLVALIKRRRGIQSHRSEPLLPVLGGDLDAVEVHADPLVRVSDGDVERQIVGERAVVGGGEVELREGRVGGGEFELLRKKDEPENEGSEDNGEDDAVEAAKPIVHASAAASSNTHD